MNQRRIIVLGVGIFVLLNVSLQIFLIMVGLEAWINFESGIAWAAAFTSVGLAAVSLLLYRYLSGMKPRPRPDVRSRRVTSPAPARTTDVDAAGPSTSSGPRPRMPSS